MDNYSFDNSMIHISNGLIENINSENTTTFVTVSYTNPQNRRRNEIIRLVVGNNTLIFDEFGNQIPVSELRTGMAVNATFSSAMTRSIPPQSNAFVIRVVRRPVPDNISIGRIIDIDHQYRTFTTIRDRDLSSVIRFNVPRNAEILDLFGRPIPFARLVSGLRVRVRHASFMTASIPPQTTAFEVQVIR